jgi:hypothetical protein
MFSGPGQRRNPPEIWRRRGVQTRRRWRIDEAYGTIFQIRIKKAGGEIRATGGGVNKFLHISFVTIFFIAGTAQTSTRVNVPHAPAKNVSLNTKGAAFQARRFARLLAVALDEHGINLVSDPHNADTFVDWESTEKQSISTLYGIQAHFDIALKDGSASSANLCGSISGSPNSELDEIILPYDWKKTHSSVKKFFIDPEVSGEPGRLLRKGLDEMELVDNREEADAVIKRVEINRGEIKMQAKDRTIIVYVLVLGSPRIRQSSESDTVYESVQQPLDSQVSDCLSLAKTYIHPDSEDKSWNQALSLASFLANHE